MVKNIIMSFFAAILAVFIVGCDKIPTPERMKAISTVVGKTAGYACELSKTKTAVKVAVSEVLDVASTVVPGEGQTFAEAWKPVIKEELSKLVAEGKIGQDEANVAEVALNAAAYGIDYIFIKHPKAKDVKELVSVSVASFVEGYKSVVTLSSNSNVEIDEEAYKYVRSKLSAGN